MACGSTGVYFSVQALSFITLGSASHRARGGAGARATRSRNQRGSTDRGHPFDPDEAPFMPHSCTVTFAK
jgi:hypothetical protein